MWALCFFFCFHFISILFCFVFLIIHTSIYSYNLNIDHLIELVVRIARERDKYHTDWFAQVTPSSNDAKFSTSETTVNQTTANNTDQNHLAVELADLKSKLRKLRQDL